MTTVGIRELKANLSHYIRLVRAGERVLITHRGEEVAELVSPSRERDALRELIDAGLVVWSGGKPAGSPGRGAKVRGGPVSDTVSKLRG